MCIHFRQKTVLRAKGIHFTPGGKKYPEDEQEWNCHWLWIKVLLNSQQWGECRGKNRGKSVLPLSPRVGWEVAPCPSRVPGWYWMNTAEQRMLHPHCVQVCLSNSSEPVKSSSFLLGSNKKKVVRNACLCSALQNLSFALLLQVR